MTHHSTSGQEKVQQVPDVSFQLSPVNLKNGNIINERVQSKPNIERQKVLLGIFFDCFEALRNKELEAAKRDLERCRRDRLLVNGAPKIAEVTAPAKKAECCSSDSHEPKTKRARCRGPVSCSRMERRSDKLTTQVYVCPPEWPLLSCSSASQNDLKHDKSSQNRVPTCSSKQFENRVERNMDALLQAYTDTRGKKEGADGHNDAVPESSTRESDLSEFGKIIEETTRYGETVHLAALKYDISSSGYQSTVSSLEFSSADNSLFSVADISRTIQVFDIKTVLKEPNEFHYPIAKMDCNAKISCVAWSPLMASVMVNSGYDGSVTVWDINKVRRLRKFNEHEKRCWSVSFARTDNHICATGSNDCSVKIWNLNMANSVMTIRPYFVVCTVNFGFTKNELAVGSADRSVYLYDLRQPLRPLNVFAGHRQAVSYVRYLNPEEIVSASTDNNLRLWNVRSAECTRVYSGHRNTKNFVGLSSCGDHILTGSEDNRAYVYYKAASRPILCYDVDSTRSVDQANLEKSHEKGEYNSAKKSTHFN
ncbi:E3 ubiquitin-protein ligase RFWD2 [Trichostrongylus colubriformis]|uniref:E3 ubiquitin-protein ligase RFWD2 n=1 Tax=Trichostrongylus colubriformis TaxID=6319 RepID=A0AAN8FPN4_TRICO